MSKIAGKNPPKRGDVYWVCFDPTLGTGIKKTRPALILSNNLFNKHLSRLIVVPISSNITKVYDFESVVSVNEKSGKAMLDQIREIDKLASVKKFVPLLLKRYKTWNVHLKKFLH
jgi:mRNA interferase MazF